jgi:hypothetical protein
MFGGGFLLWAWVVARSINDALSIHKQQEADRG